MLTLDELMDRLAERADEVLLLELLNINSYDLVKAFSERVEEKYEELLNEWDD